MAEWESGSGRGMGEGREWVLMEIYECMKFSNNEKFRAECCAGHKITKTKLHTVLLCSLGFGDSNAESD